MSVFTERIPLKDEIDHTQYESALREIARRQAVERQHEIEAEEEQLP